MDSFRILFACDCPDDAIRQAASEVDALAEARGPDEFSVSGGPAQVWIDRYAIFELPPSAFDGEADWPLNRDEVRSLAEILVRRDDDSARLGVDIAKQLVSKCCGYILWDGADYWQRL